MLSKNQLQTICLQNSGHTECRYLMYSNNGGAVCSKQLIKEKQARDKIVNSYILDCKKKGIDPKTNWPYGFSGTSIGLGTGNNCSGYPVLSSIIQGFDIDLGITNKGKGGKA